MPADRDSGAQRPGRKTRARRQLDNAPRGSDPRGYSTLETDRQRSQPRGQSPTHTVRLWPTELGHLVQDVTRDHGLGHSPASGPGAKPIPENRLVPKARMLHPRLELVAGLLLPAAPAERPHVRDRAISRAHIDRGDPPLQPRRVCRLRASLASGTRRTRVSRNPLIEPPGRGEGAVSRSC